MQGTKRSGWRWSVVAGLAVATSCSGVEAPPTEPAPAPRARTAGVGDTQTVWLMLRDQADLAPARGMRDWRARGQMVFDQLTSTAARAQEPLRALLRSHGVSHQPFWIVNAIKVTAPPALIGLLGRLPEVASVHPDRTISLPPQLEGHEQPRGRVAEWGVENIGAPDVWERFGFRGEGVVVASIDTGVDFTHPALTRQYRGRQGDGTLDHNYNWYDPAGICGAPSLAPCDNAGHGTHTMGIIVGEDEQDPAATRIGVAPHARWIAAKGCESGDCSLSSLMKAGEWMLAPTDLRGQNPRPDMRPHIVNNSWSAGAGDDLFFQKIVKAWVAAGIFPVFASGNDGPGCSSADSPADYAESYAVGAHDSENKIAGFSSRGSTKLGGVKPNISAPGVNIRSSIPGGAYGISNGTSMATPHVSGAVALIWSAAPALVGDIAGTRALLDQTAIDTEDLSCGGTAANNNVFGEGRLDALAAVSQAPRAPTGTLQGSVQAVADGRPVVARDARIRAQGPADRSVAVDSSGTYTLVLPQGHYRVTVSAFGFVSQTSEVVITSEERSRQDFVLEPAPAHVVRGVVRQADGRPLGGARVTIEGTPLLAAVSDQYGSYTLTGVPPGHYEVSAARGGCFGRARQPLSVDGDAQLDLSLPRRTDYYGYSCEPLRAGFIDATSVLPLDGGRTSVTVPLPFGFSFYGRLYQEVEVSRAGYLGFGAAAPALPRRPAGRNGVTRIPDGQLPNAAVYAFWDDLVVDEAASVRTETTGSAPDRAFVVEWRNVAFRDQPQLRVRFEVVLYEDGRILTQYFTAGPDARQHGGSATVGLEDADGVDGLEYSDHDPSLDSGSALLYALPPSGILEGQVTDATDGQPLPGVQLLSWSDEAGVRTTTTDSEGRYRLELRVGSHSVGASAPYYGEQTRQVSVVQGEALHLDLALTSGRAQVAPAALTIASDRAPASTSFTLENHGTREVAFDAHALASAEDEQADDLPWVQIQPASGTVPPGTQQTFTVTADRDKLSPGSYQAQIVLWTDTPSSSAIRLPLAVVVAGPVPPAPGRAGSAAFGELRAPGRAQQKRAWLSFPQPAIESSSDRRR